MSLPHQKSIAVVHTRVWNMNGLETAPGPTVKRRSSRRRRCVDCKVGESALSGSCVLHTPRHVGDSQDGHGVRLSDVRMLGQEDFQTPPSINSESSSPSDSSSANEELISVTRYLFSNIRVTTSERDSILETLSDSLDDAEKSELSPLNACFSSSNTTRARQQPKEEYTEEAYRGFETWVMGSFEQMFCFAKGDCSGMENDI